MTNPNRLFIHYLVRLRALLLRIDAFDSGITGQRLHPDMFPLLQQATTAIGFSLRATCPLAGRDIVSFRQAAGTLASTLAELDATLAYLAALPDDAFDGRDGLRVQTAAGCADLDLSARDYYDLYAMPNFFFHYAMVYAIARQAGVPIGKADFDGFHSYPADFTFATAADPAT